MHTLEKQIKSCYQNTKKFAGDGKKSEDIRIFKQVKRHS